MLYTLNLDNVTYQLHFNELEGGKDLQRRSLVYFTVKA